LAVAAAAAMLLSSGCGKSDKVTDPWPPSGSTGELEPNDATAQNLGVLGTADVVVAGTAASTTDVDQFVITLTQATNLGVQISWSGSSDLDVGVMNPSGFMVNFQDTGANPEHCTLPALDPGIYTVRAIAKSASGQKYVLTIGPR
jgi:hypothetical protein